MCMSLKIKLLLVSLAAACLFSCADESIVLAPEALGLEYYPIEEGQYWIYEVDSTVVIGGGASLFTSQSYVKEEITGSFTNSQGVTSFVLTISNSNTLDGTYVVTDVWKVEKSDTRVIRFEENRAFIKLVFPIKEGVSVENVLFDEQVELNIAQQKMRPYLNWDYKVLEAGGFATVANKNYNNIIRVQQANNQADFANEVNFRVVEEIYAPNIGMIERRMEIFDTDCLGCLEPWIEKADRGYEVTQRLVDHN